MVGDRWPQQEACLGGDPLRCGLSVMSSEWRDDDRARGRQSTLSSRKAAGASQSGPKTVSARPLRRRAAAPPSLGWAA